MPLNKGFVGKKPQPRVAMTGTGRTVFSQHVAALKEILDAGDGGIAL